MSRQSKYIRFQEREWKGKTKRWTIETHMGVEIGQVHWHGAWRQYCFFPGPDTLYERVCLRTIADFCEAKTREHIGKLPRLSAEEKSSA